MGTVNGQLTKVVSKLRRLALGREAAPLSDQDLLRHFIGTHDEAAFATLVNRHGPMIIGICRRTLRHTQDAEDAFQATFLVLARKAASIRKQESVAGWLHAVACRVAGKLRSTRARRRSREHTLIDETPGKTIDDLTWREVQTVLDEELNRLADKYRGPLLLCYMQGRTRDEAAGQLGLKLGVLRGRLDRGRELLRARLARRGLSLSAALLAFGLATTVNAAPAALVTSAVAAASSGIASAHVVALTQGVIQAMFLTKLKAVVLGVATFTLLGTGAGLVTYGAWAGEAPTQAQAQRTKAKDEDDPIKLKQEIERLRIELATTRLELFMTKEKFEILKAQEAAERRRAQYQEEKARAAEQDTRAHLEALYRKGLISEAQKALGQETTAAQSLLNVIRAAQDPAQRKQYSDTKASAVTGFYPPATALSTRQAQITPVAVSPDGRVVIVAQGQTFHVIDVKSGKLIATCTGHETPVSAVAFSPDGKLLASSDDKSVAIWDVTTVKQIRQIQTPSAVGSIHFSPDRGTIVIRRSDGSERAFDINSGREVKKEQRK